MVSTSHDARKSQCPQVMVSTKSWSTEAVVFRSHDVSSHGALHRNHNTHKSTWRTVMMKRSHNAPKSWVMKTAMYSGIWCIVQKNYEGRNPNTRQPWWAKVLIHGHCKAWKSGCTETIVYGSQERHKLWCMQVWSHGTQNSWNTDTMMCRGETVQILLYLEDIVHNSRKSWCMEIMTHGSSGMWKSWLMPRSSDS